MSKKKEGGKTSQHVNPEGKRLGVKVGNGEHVIAGMVLIRQRGTQIKAGEGVNIGRDHTLFAIREGKVKFGQKFGRTKVSVVKS